MSILVLGLGNAVMTDDGFGPRVVRALEERYTFSGPISIIDGGTLGLDLLPRLEGIDRLLVVDALEMDAEPGEVFRLVGDEVPRAFANKLSVHQMGVQDLLAVAELQGHLPPELVVWGTQPGCIEMGLELTPAVTEALETVTSGIIDELSNWGIDVKSAA